MVDDEAYLTESFVVPYCFTWIRLFLFDTLSQNTSNKTAFRPILFEPILFFRGGVRVSVCYLTLDVKKSTCIMETEPISEAQIRKYEDLIENKIKVTETRCLDNA